MLVVKYILLLGLWYQNRIPLSESYIDFLNDDLDIGDYTSIDNNFLSEKGNLFLRFLKFNLCKIKLTFNWMLALTI